MKQLDMKATTFAAILAGAMLLTGCAPEVGSPDWCEDMKGKETGDWTANEVAEFTRSCLIRKEE